MVTGVVSIVIPPTLAGLKPCTTCYLLLTQIALSLERMLQPTRPRNDSIIIVAWLSLSPPGLLRRWSGCSSLPGLAMTFLALHVALGV